MPDIRGQGLPFILTQPWKLSRLPQDGPPYNPNFPTGQWIQLAQHRRETITAHGYRGVVILTKPPFLPQPLRVTAASQAAARRSTVRLLHGPVLVIPAPLPARRSWFVRPATQRGYSRFQPPVAVAPAAAAFLPRPLRATLAKPGAQRPKPVAQFRGPAVVTAPTPWQIGPLYQLTAFPRGLTRRGYSSSRPPLLTAAAFQPAPIRVYLGKPTAARPRGRSQFRPPAVVNTATATSAPLRVTLARYQRPASATVRAGVPTIVAPASTATLPVTTSLHPAAWAPTRLRLSHPTLRPPAVIAPAATVTNWQIGAAIQLTSFPRARYRIGFGYLAAPAIVNPSFTPAAPLRVTLAAGELVQLRRGRSQLRPPTILAPFATPTLRNRTITVTLARRQWAVQPTHSRMPGPTIVGAAPTTPPSAQQLQDIVPILTGW